MKKVILLILGIVFVAIIVAVVVFVGNLKETVEGLQPDIRNVSLEWGEVNDNSIEVLGTLTVYNPNSVSLPVNKITCEVELNGIRVGSAETIDLKIAKATEFPLRISAKIDTSKIPSVWAEHIRRNEKSEASIKIKATFDLGVVEFTFPYTVKQPFETDLLSQLTSVGPVPVEKKVKVPLLGEKTIFNMTLEALSGTWGKATPDISQINISAVILNDNPYPLLVPKVKSEIESNGIIVGYGETGLLNAFGPHDTKEVKLVASLYSSQMSAWFVRHVQQGEKSIFNIRVYIEFKVVDDILKLIGQDELSVTLWEGNQIIETDLLGNK